MQTCRSLPAPLHVLGSTPHPNFPSPPGTPTPACTVSFRPGSTGPLQLSQAQTKCATGKTLYPQIKTSRLGEPKDTKLSQPETQSSLKSGSVLAPLCTDGLIS